MRRILQSTGAEVVHLGHNQSASAIVDAAVEEDAQGIGVSSYQGGHNEFFRYMIELLAEKGARHIQIFGGGGGVIVPDEIQALQQDGVSRIYSPEDGQRLGLQGIINDMVERCDQDPIGNGFGADQAGLAAKSPMVIARLITLAEAAAEGDGRAAEKLSGVLEAFPAAKRAPVIGFTGTGGAGKSSLLDELVRRFLRDFGEDRHVAILCVDPTRRRTGGALLGDRIRMNAIQNGRAYMRSMATRESRSEVSGALKDAIRVVQAAGFDLVLLETSGIGQASSAVTEIADVTAYVMTPEYGAPSQLEKIEMLDHADFVVLNKFERRGAQDALRDIQNQVRRNRGDWHADLAAMPVFPTIAAQFNDPGVNAFYGALLDRVGGLPFGTGLTSSLGFPTTPVVTEQRALIPPDRLRYLSDVSSTARAYRARVEEEADRAGRAQAAEMTAAELEGRDGDGTGVEAARSLAETLRSEMAPASRDLLAAWPEIAGRYEGETQTYEVRGREIEEENFFETLAGTRMPLVARPRTESARDLLRFLALENLPGYFPFTAGVFPFKRRGEDPKRQFAGEGGPGRTNQRFHYLTRADDAKRMSVAFDSVTLYGEDPAHRPDIFGKIGEGGVSIATLEDMRTLMGGFDLLDPRTSVSMTINGPAPIVLAMFMNAAIDQQVDRFREREGRVPDAGELERLSAETLRSVRGTVQADILKEDQAQNTCIFSIEFALRMMGDVAEFFARNDVRNFYSVSISGYHIAEAGANPITQLALTLANGFTYVEYYLGRGMDIDDFAPNLSFFFSNGLDAEYSVLGRVARRIWSVAMRERYGANPRSQKFKYHIQTSGRSLHAQEIDFNDIRTTLQGLMAIYDNCNSLHTNSYDEAITTPTEQSVRRAMAIQYIILREFGLAKNQNSLQGSFIIEELTDLVEEAVLMEFDRITERGGVLGAMELGYQRSKIQDESIKYEMMKDSGELPIVGVNTYVDPETLKDDYVPPATELARATDEEKEDQIRRLQAFQTEHQDRTAAALERLKEVALSGENVFAELMKSVRVASLGQITHALYEVGGQYRRSL
jgi:methylmalonyl-CoA mutase